MVQRSTFSRRLLSAFSAIVLGTTVMMTGATDTHAATETPTSTSESTASTSTDSSPTETSESTAPDDAVSEDVTSDNGSADEAATEQAASDDAATSNQAASEGEISEEASETVTLELTNKPADSATGWAVGETMQFDVTVTNNETRWYGFQPTESNLSNYEDCKWRKVDAGESFTCEDSITHEVTQADATNGTFTPSITYSRYSQDDYNGNGVELSPATVEAETIVAGSTASTEESSDLTPPTTSITIVDPKGEGVPYAVGETITFNLSITNEATVAASFQVTDSNLTNFAGCKYTEIEPQGEYSCNLASHVVTAEDAEAGSFTPQVTWTMFDQINYAPTPGTVLPVTEGPVIAVAEDVASLGEVTLTSQEQETYAAGDELTFSVDATNNSSTQPLTFELDDSSSVTGQCETTSVATGDKVTCADLSYTLTEDDIVMGTTTATVVVNAMKDDAIVQQLTADLEVTTEGDWPDATAYQPNDADPRLSAALTSLDMLASTDSDNKYRIPTITVASNGDLLASYDLRPLDGGANGGDSPNANWIVQRRSTDNGETWGPQTVIAKGNNGEDDGAGREGYSDPSYVVDYETGTIFNFHVYSQQIGVFAQTNDDGEIVGTPPSYEKNADGTINEDYEYTMNLAVSKSTDNGYTWESDIITDEVLRDYAGQLQSCFATSGGGTQVQHGDYAGRLVQQLACVEKDNTTVRALSVYSDDNGETWQAGSLTSLDEDVTTSDKKWLWNENKVVELSDGTLMLNSRTYEETSENAADGEAFPYRIVATSEDGGVTWKDYHTDEGLTDPGNNASIIRAFPNAEEGTLRSKVLLFSNTNSSTNRTNGTISVSYDDGETWSVKKEFRSGGTGYTSMTIQDDGSIGLLLEPSSGGWTDIAYLNTTLAYIDPELPTELTIEPESDARYQTGVDGEQVSIPVEITGDDPALENTVTLTGLPTGFTYDEEAGAIVGTPSLDNSESKTYNAKLTITEADDGTDIPREASYSFVFVLAPEGGSADYSGQTWYVSADGDDANDGLSEENPFQTLNPVNDLELLPGDKVLLRRGDTFNDQYLHIKGSGSEDAEIEIGAYGDESKDDPVINANSSGQWYQNYNTSLDNANHVFKGMVSSAILLKDVEYVRVHDIEVTNKRSATDTEQFNDAEALDRTGVAVIAENAGTIHSVTIEDMYIHNVEGNIYNKHMANGGIYVIAHKPLDEAATGIARFDGVNILNNRVEEVSRWGIGVGYSAYTAEFDASEIPDDVAETYGQTNVVVKGNYVKEAGGDSITVFYSLRPLVEYNVSQDGAVYINDDDYLYSTTPDGKQRGGQVAAAIWSWKSKDALFQYNESFNTLNSAEGNGDGQAWDADWGDGTVYQYNYSHGNTGGAVMFCGAEVVNSTFRFNISHHDLGGLIDIPDQLPEAHIYNNTFVMAENVPVLGKHPVAVKSGGSVAIENNIFYYTGDEAAPATVGNWTAGTGTRTWDNNLYYNFSSTPTDVHQVVVDDTTTQVLVDPTQAPLTSLTTTTQARAHLGASGTEFEGFRLAEDSPAANTGKTISDRNDFPLEADFFGQAITGVPDIGAVQADGEAPDLEIEGTSVEEWQAHNEGLDDYATLQEKLAETSETMTWLFTGDSITHGVLHTNGLKRYTEYFEDYLRTDSLAGQDRSEDVVLNTGVSSATTGDGWLEDYSDSWIGDRQADVVFMTFGMNDGRSNALPLAEYQENLAAAVEEVRAAGGIPVLMTQNYTTTEVYNTNLKAYFNAVRDLAEEEDVLIVDFNRWWVEHNRGVEINSDLMNDGIHPNEQGQLYWAQLIVETLGMEDCSRLALATDAQVTDTGRTVVMPDEVEEPEVFAPENFAGSTGVVDEDSFLTAPKKSFADAVESLTLDGEGAEGLEAFAAADEGNLTIRFKLTDDADTNTEMILAAFGNAETGAQLTLSVYKNQMRLGWDAGTGEYDFYSFFANDAPVVDDGQFHTLSVNIGANTLQAWVDDVRVLNYTDTTTALNLDPTRYDIDTVTLGGALEEHLPTGTQNAQATIDYVQAFNRVLTAEEIADFETATPIEVAESEDDGISADLKALYNNSVPQMWSFLGGSTTQGTTGELSAKNYVQAFEEVLRWEHGATPEVLRMKFVQNAGLSGLDSAELLERYQAVVAEQDPDVVFIAPDVLVEGELVEESVESFKTNIESIVTAAQEANPDVQVVLMTPAQLGDEVESYAAALRELADETDASIIDATAWVNEVADVNEEGVVAAEWYDTNQVMTAKGHVELAKFVMETIDMMPSDTTTSKIWALNYDGVSTDQVADAPEFVANRPSPAEPVA